MDARSQDFLSTGIPMVGSESGKLVQKLFARVTEMVEDESGFVVVLIGRSLTISTADRC
jgi:hypothetical protein